MQINELKKKKETMAFNVERGKMMMMMMMMMMMNESTMK